MNFATALAIPATPPVDTAAQRKADHAHAQMLKLVDALCRSPLVPGTDSVH
ncbi:MULTISPECIES: hypothetical protein [Pseudomonas]|jgi:hypothetical protein|uniref:hypothetical protein n=1 Tax=Pseudomonas TaxID=286 RepID=UPI0018D6C13F|nr:MULTISPECIES: hypothetical protein [Pseudomonas]MBH3373400.1 hypothetical protein [Pseudomonas juntendi]MBS6039450.1 hypothetical protein [Pseudomonas sp.]CAH0646795.1 hypothetical protein PSNVIR_01045 [Pseudomonas sp. Nvir]